jgi:hypothetical protein
MVSFNGMWLSASISFFRIIKVAIMSALCASTTSGMWPYTIQERQANLSEEGMTFIRSTTHSLDFLEVVPHRTLHFPFQKPPQSSDLRTDTGLLKVPHGNMDSSDVLDDSTSFHPVGCACGEMDSKATVEPRGFRGGDRRRHSKAVC